MLLTHTTTALVGADLGEIPIWQHRSVIWSFTPGRTAGRAAYETSLCQATPGGFITMPAHASLCQAVPGAPCPPHVQWAMWRRQQLKGPRCRSYAQRLAAHSAEQCKTRGAGQARWQSLPAAQPIQPASHLRTCITTPGAHCVHASAMMHCEPPALTYTSHSLRLPHFTSPHHTGPQANQARISV
jgi:hypothetical protein